MHGIISTLTDVRTQLSNCAALRTWLGVTTPTQAVARIKFFGGELDANPMVVIAPDGAWQRDQVTIDQQYLTTPAVVCEFIKVVTKTDSDETVFTALCTSIDSVMAQFEANTTWGAFSWRPDAENTPARAKASAHDDVASYRIAITGNLQS